MKLCPTCKLLKSYSEFYKNKAQPDGYGCHCKECERKYKRINVSIKRKEYLKNYLVNYRLNGNGGKTEYREENPEKVIASKLVYYAVKSGYMEKPLICEHCGKTKPLHGHHANGYYGKSALDVIWLCNNCHRKEHRII